MGLIATDRVAFMSLFLSVYLLITFWNPAKMAESIEMQSVGCVDCRVSYLGPRNHLLDMG